MEGESYDGFSSFIQQMLIDLLLCAGALRALELWEVERTLASMEILIFYGIWTSKPYKAVCGDGKRSHDIAKEEEIFSGSGLIKDAVMEDIGTF